MIIVTGGAGFIGSCLIKYLNERGYFNILVVDQLDNAEKWKNLLKISFNDFIAKDDLLAKLKQIPKVSEIYHLGSDSLTDSQDGNYIMQNNYEYTKNLCRHAIINRAKFVYASSAGTYGAGEHGYDDLETGLVNLKPLDLYEYSKHLFDLYAQRNDLFRKHRIIGLKYFDVYGPAEEHKGDMGSMVLRAYLQYKKSKVVKLFKSYRKDIEHGEQKRDFIYVKDAVKLTYYLAHHPERLGGIFNIGSGEAHSFNELVAALAEAVGRNIEPTYVAMPVKIRAKYQYFIEANINKLLIQTTLPSYPLPKGYTLKEGIFDYVVNYMEKENFSINTLPE
ncbi:MAG: ADP-glyceromanno-heptose 6-epimerase [SAR324 cluster bacterium]|nr:ADP-glyceromanno-heptose 6-epimerase [SAR324 cluster bacterium]